MVYGQFKKKVVTKMNIIITWHIRWLLVQEKLVEGYNQVFNLPYAMNIAHGERCISGKVICIIESRS